MTKDIAAWLVDRFAGWRKRHRNTTNFYLHMLGIPACFVAAPILLILGQWILAPALFVGGYALQFTGHLVEGNRSGEEMLIRRLVGKQ
jgi:uncharacterized membrane protein YGL010W